MVADAMIQLLGLGIGIAFFILVAGILYVINKKIFAFIVLWSIGCGLFAALTAAIGSDLMILGLLGLGAVPFMAAGTIAVYFIRNLIRKMSEEQD